MNKTHHRAGEEKESLNGARGKEIRKRTEIRQGKGRLRRTNEKENYTRVS